VVCVSRVVCNDAPPPLDICSTVEAYNAKERVVEEFPFTMYQGALLDLLCISTRRRIAFKPCSITAPKDEKRCVYVCVYVCALSGFFHGSSP
jgi:hypothetical protein